MTLNDLRTYYRLREYQISHLLNAMECHKRSKYAYSDQQMYTFLFWWADAMHQADEMTRRDPTGYVEAHARKSRGLA